MKRHYGNINTKQWSNRDSMNSSYDRIDSSLIVGSLFLHSSSKLSFKDKDYSNVYFLFF